MNITLSRWITTDDLAIDLAVVGSMRSEDYRPPNPHCHRRKIYFYGEGGQHLGTQVYPWDEGDRRDAEFKVLQGLWLVVRRENA